MKVIDTAIGGDSIRRQAQPFPQRMGCAVHVGANFSHRWLCYEASDNLRRPGHQHWIKCPYSNPSALTHPDIASYLEDSRITGIVYQATWRALETSQGVYDFSKITAALDRCAVLGKRMIVRVVCKVYTQDITDPGSAIPLPAKLGVPDYIAADNGVYGGTAFRGGIYPVYLGGTGVGWGAQFETAAVLTRWRALVTAAGAAFGNHSAFDGWIGPDESARSSFNGSSLPAGHSFATISGANRAVYQHDAATFGAAKCWPCVNYVDSEKSLATANDDTVGEMQWAAQQGYNVAFSDIYRMPDEATAFMQPVYWTDARTSLAQGRRVLSHVDLLSLDANDAGLPRRMFDCAIQSYRLGSDITAWHYFVSNSTDRAAYWAAQQAAMDATTAFRT